MEFSSVQFISFKWNQDSSINGGEMSEVSDSFNAFL
jgi:hypothetical protein